MSEAAAPAKATLSGGVELPEELLRSANVRGTLSGDRRDLEAAEKHRVSSGEREGAKAAPAAAKGTLSGDDGGARGTLSGDDEVVGEGTFRGTLSGDGGGARGTLSGDDDAPAPPPKARPRRRSPEGEPGMDTMAEGLSAFDYDVQGALGRGGMGIIWNATQKSLGRPVAVKTLRPELVGGPSSEKFEAEAFVTGRLEHPNIPPVHAYGHDDVGRPYLAMKLVKGVEWGKLLDPGTPEEKARAAKTSLRDHLEIIRKVCEAVAFAHAHGVLHRDLKPENVMVGEFGEVLVMDWGIALDLRARPSAPPQGLRRPVGTPAYLPPEMALADESRMGPWTDIYLVGGLLYELLTGATPHEGDSILAVLLAAQKGEIVPPRLRAQGRQVPERLAEITMRCLHPEPRKRYQTAREVEDAIEEYITNEASLKLSAAALADFAEAERAIAAGRATQSGTYAALASVVADLRQAVKLWEGNAGAKDGLTRARVFYAGYALAQGDLVLAEAQLEQIPRDDPLALPVRAKVQEVRLAREAEALRRRRMRFVLLGLVLVVVGLGFMVVREVRKTDKRAAAEEVTSGATYAAPTERVEMFKRGVAIDPSWAEGWSNCGRAYEAMSYALCCDEKPTASAEALVEATRCLVTAADLDPTNPTTIGDRAYVKEMSGDPEGCRRDHKIVYDLAPETLEGIQARGMIALFERDYPTVVTMESRSLAWQPSETDYFRRGMAKFALGDLDGALADARSAEKLSSTGEDEWYHSEMALAYLAKGDVRNAGERILRGLRFLASGSHILPLAAYHAARLGDIERSQALLERAREMQKAHEKAWLARSPTWEAARFAPAPYDVPGKALNLELDLTTVYPKEPALSVVLRRRGEERFAKGEIELALADSERSLAEDPADGSARLLRGRALIELGHVDQARSDLSVVERLAPNRRADLEAALRRADERQRELRAGKGR